MCRITKAKGPLETDYINIMCYKTKEHSIYIYIGSQ